jgi:hypothetical protein
MSYWVDSPQAMGPVDRTALGKKMLETPAAEFDVVVPVKGEGQDELAVSLDYYFCRHGATDGVCSRGSVVFSLPLSISADGRAEPLQLRHMIEASE